MRCKSRGFHFHKIDHFGGVCCIFNLVPIPTSSNPLWIEGLATSCLSYNSLSPAVSVANWIFDKVIDFLSDKHFEMIFQSEFSLIVVCDMNRKIVFQILCCTLR